MPDAKIQGLRLKILKLQWWTTTKNLIGTQKHYKKCDRRKKPEEVKRFQAMLQHV